MRARSASPRSKPPRRRRASAIAAAAAKLSAARAKAAERLDKAVNGELKPLKLERAKFSTQIVSEPDAAGANGIDRVEFWVQTNPGTRPGR
jgi:DNA repair protein RecN (Recombination protein N)